MKNNLTKIFLNLFSLFFLQSHLIHAQKFVENNGLVVMEVESVPIPSGWERRTNISGFSGTAFYYGTADFFGEGGNHILNYKISIQTAGTYQLNIRSRIALGSSSTDANDQYVRMLGPDSKTLTPVQNDNYETGRWLKFYQNKTSTWMWQTSNKDNDPRSISYNLTPGDYWIQISMRSLGCAIDRIALWDNSRYNFSPITGNPTSTQISSLNALTNSTTVSDPNLIPNAPSDGPFPDFVSRRFNKATDVLIAQFDNKPDADDIQSQAALGSILAHPSYSDINFMAVAGAYGTQSGTYINSNTLFTMAFGAQNIKWTDAHNERTNSINRIVDKVKPILQAGGMVWVQEAGQSDITFDWVSALISQGIPTATIKNNVVVVQHSKWNENATTTAELTYVKKMTTYASIDDGNLGFGIYSQERQKRQFPTPGYETAQTNFITEATNSANPNLKARQLWTEANRIIVASGFKASYSVIPKGGVDFSDCVENWYILDLGSSGNTVRSFWDNYVVNGTVPTTFTLSTSATSGGTVSSGGTFNSGTVASVTATPNSGFTFTGWSGDLTGTTNPGSITMNSNKTVTANFAPIVTTFTLTTSATSGGTVTGGGTFNSGTVASVTATPNSGFTFTGWSGDLTGTTNPGSITMNSNKTVTANFAPIVTTFTLTTSATSGGTVSSGGTFNSGTVASVTATPSSGFTFTGWSGDLSGISNPGSITMNSNKTVTANFAAINNSPITALTSWSKGIINPKVSGSNRVFVVMVMGESTASSLSATVTYGGQAMTRQIQRFHVSSRGSYAAIFTLLESKINLATNGNIVVSWSNTSGLESVVYSAFYGNVDQSTSLFNSSSNGLNGTAISTQNALTTSVGDVALMCGMNHTNNTVSFTNGFTKQFESNSGFGDAVGGFKLATGSSETPRYTQSSSGRMVICGIILKRANQTSSQLRTSSTALDVQHNEEMIRTQEIGEEIHIYPNPAQGNLTIKSNELSKKIQFFNVLGQLVHSVDSNKSTTNINLNASNLKTGTYIIHISSENKKTSHKIVIE